MLRCQESGLLAGHDLGGARSGFLGGGSDLTRTDSSSSDESFKCVSHPEAENRGKFDQPILLQFRPSSFVLGIILGLLLAKANLLALGL